MLNLQNFCIFAIIVKIFASNNVIKLYLLFQVLRYSVVDMYGEQNNCKEVGFIHIEYLIFFKNIYLVDNFK